MSENKIKAHLFICTNSKEKGECCKSKGGEKLRIAVKKLMDEKHPEWKGQYRVNGSGCLGRCEDGIASVLYPQSVWKTNLTLDSTNELFQLLESEINKN